MKCFYKLHIKGPTVLFEKNDEECDISSSAVIAADCMHMIFDSVGTKDMPFITEMFQICKDQMYYGCYIMSVDDGFCNFSQLDILAEQFFEKGMPKLIVSIPLAIQHSFSENVFVGTCCAEQGVIYPQAINAGSLCINNFRNTLPIARQIAVQLTDYIPRNVIDIVVWLDYWLQKNIQYIKNRETVAGGKIYVCEHISKEAIMSDVFINHYGVCEDIATSAAILLTLLGVECKEVQAEGHAWLLVNIENEQFIWDCTHNITRNVSKKENALQAAKYSNQYTLIGAAEFAGKYVTLELKGFEVSQESIPRESIQKSIDYYKALGFSFIYNEKPNYTSIIKEN